MNNMPYPYFPSPFSPIPQQNNLDDELKYLKTEISKLKERIEILENKKKNDYLKKDDTLYML